MNWKARLQALVLTIGLIHISLLAAHAQAPGERKRVDGVTNFGQVTEHYFRGGELTTEGIKNLAALGIRTIIDLRDDAEPEEAETCKQVGITYYNFPLDQYATPDQATVDKIFQIIREAKEPVFVHCSGGKHRAGTLCALYRMKHQGWSAARAWREQQAYGFGPPEEHPQLFLYAYGNTPIAKRLRQEADKQEADKQEADKQEAGRQARGNEKTANGEMASPRPSASPKPSPVAAPVAATEAATPEAALSSTARYVSPAQALERARAEGAAGELARINLEYDTKRAVPVWKVIFSTAMEYRYDARTGALLATKPKPAEGLSVLSPLTLSERFLTFQKIIAIAERLTGQKAAEMELKRVRGRNQTFYEVAMADGVTLFFDALTGKQIKEF